MVPLLAVGAAAEKLALGPEDGAVKATVTPETGLPLASVTFTTSGLANAAPMVALWPPPETVVTAAGVGVAHPLGGGATKKIALGPGG
ncbi:MAG: hypothetical protein WBA09_21140 [Candidatus Acidiferrum sp.]